MTESIVNKKSSPLFTTNNNNNNQSRNTIVLNGHSNFSSLRIEDPKKAATNNIENDVYVKIMMNNVPQIQQYFNIVDKIGEGTFSKVYKAKLKHCIEMDDNNQNNNGNNNNEEYALKYIIPIVKPSRIAKELRFLRDLGGQSNIIPIKTCFYNAGHTIVVMPIVEHDRFQDYLNDLSLTEIRSYMRNLFIALDRVHSHGIIHRDIKPSNFLYNRSNGQFALVDFGLSQNERELYHSINLSLYPYPNKSSMKPTISNHDSKVRKNLCSKFQKNSTKIEDGKLKRSFNEMNQSMIIVDNENVKRKKLDHSQQQQQTSSVFISPLTPSMMTMKDSKSTTTTSPKSIFVPGTPVKKPFNEHETNIMTTNDTTPVKDQWIYKTPTKTDEMFMVNNEMVIKTPIKTVSSIPETPPKTVQKNLHFSRATPPAPPPIINFQSKENINHNYNTPKKLSKPLNYRFQTMKKSLNQELSTSLSNVGNNTVVGGGGGGGGNIVDNIHKKSSNQHQQQQQRLCDCTQTSTICQNCLSKIELNVPRAGTPGFRAPEILLRYSNQSTKIDIWSCGVIFASLLSGRYPFFRCNDDITCLAEIITILGSTKIKRAANALGKTLTISRRSIPAMDLKKICIKLKKTSTTANDDNDNDTSSNKWYQAPDSAYNLLERLLDPNPNTRFSAAEALSHPFIIGIDDNQHDDVHDDNESSF